MPVCSAIVSRNSPPFSASRTALVATATICRPGAIRPSRRNFDSTWSADVHDLWGERSYRRVRRRPAGPFPSRDRSTSKDRSGRSRTTIMCSELVPMSMAAIRIIGSFGLNEASAIIPVPVRSYYHARFNSASRPASRACSSALHGCYTVSRTAMSAPCTGPAWRPVVCARCCPSCSWIQRCREKLSRRLRKVTAAARRGSRTGRAPGPDRRVGRLRSLSDDGAGAASVGVVQGRAGSGPGGFAAKRPVAELTTAGRASSRRSPAASKPRTATPRRHEDRRTFVAVGTRRARGASGDGARGRHGRGRHRVPARTAPRDPNRCQEAALRA